MARRAELTLRDRLLGLIAFRLAVAAVLLATQASSELVWESFWPSFPRVVSLSVSIIFGTALVQGILVSCGVARQALVVGQVAVDLALLTAIIWVTGAANSPFAFLYCVVVLEAALALDGLGTVVTAIAASLVLFWVTVLTGQIHQAASPLAAQVAAVLAMGFLALALMGETQRTRARLVRTEGELQALGNLHERVLMGLSSGIITIDASSRIGFINPAGLSILGREGEAFGLPLDQVSPGLAALTQEQRDRGEVDIEVLGRRVMLGLSTVPLNDGAGRGVGQTLIFRDLTAIRVAERERQLNERLTALGRMAASLAHEIRNPLGSLSGSIELIAQGGKLSGDEQRLLEIVQREVARLDALISELLEYARPQAPERVRADIARIASETVHVFQCDASALHHTVACQGDQSAFARVDPGQARQILFNLLRNAVQAAPPKSTVMVTVRNLQSEVVMTVADVGPGVSEPDRIFEPFYTTKPGGTGLGLAIVAQLVRQNQGSIRVRANTPRGSVFEVTWPTS